MIIIIVCQVSAISQINVIVICRWNFEILNFFLCLSFAYQQENLNNEYGTIDNQASNPEQTLADKQGAKLNKLRHFQRALDENETIENPDRTLSDKQIAKLAQRALEDSRFAINSGTK